MNQASLLLCRDAAEVLVNKLLPPRKSITPPHGKIMADRKVRTHVWWASCLMRTGEGS